MINTKFRDNQLVKIQCKKVTLTITQGGTVYCIDDNKSMRRLPTVWNKKTLTLKVYLLDGSEIHLRNDMRKIICLEDMVPVTVDESVESVPK